MKAIAWDDEPSDYLEPLKHHLKRYGITLEIVPDPGDFLQRFRSPTEKWDFVVTDLFSPDPPGTARETPSFGLRIAQLAAQAGLPLFVVTKHFRKAQATAGLPHQAVVKSKSTHVAWMADEIHDELSRRGVFVDRTRVFLIHGHDGEAIGAREKVAAFLPSKGLVVEGISAANLQNEIAEGLVDKMNRCGGFVAICTPDDRLDDGTRRPRLNVLLEIGIAMGLSRGLERLTILQRFGPTPELTAQLPSDLQGVLTLRFADHIEVVFPALEERLRNLGLDLA